ncbi:MAG: GIY-YIG nuclease family protein [Chlorobi bacterium]|nr:GIY-YIG nuclease family protein [Chlorobiota bacterium]
MKFFVYILESDNKRHYIGQTSDLERRLYQHNHKHKGFTATAEIWNILSYIKVDSRNEAIMLERKLKSFKNFRKAIEYINKLE